MVVYYKNDMCDVFCGLTEFIRAITTNVGTCLLCVCLCAQSAWVLITNGIILAFAGSIFEVSIPLYSSFSACSLVLFLSLGILSVRFHLQNTQNILYLVIPYI